MTITYSNGTVLEAIVLAHEEEALRVAVAGDGDVRTFRRIHGVWISEECEPVAVEFAWERHGAANVPDEVDCICPKKLASRLISMLLAGTDEDDLLEDALYVLSAEGNRVNLIKAGWKATEGQALRGVPTSISGDGIPLRVRSRTSTRSLSQARIC
jgi:hypothetical protein